MTSLNITVLLNDLEKNERKALALLDMVDGGFSLEVIRAAIEELCDSSESLKLGCSAYEEPYYTMNKLNVVHLD